MSMSSFNRPGVVDLSTLAKPAPTAAGTAAGAAVVDVGVTNFEAVLQQSTNVPVVLDFGSARSPQSQQLTALLEKLAVEYGGRFVLGKVDVDTNAQLAASAQVQAIPTVLAVINGQAVPLFQGAMPEDQTRSMLDEVLKVAAANGVSGQVEVDPDAGTRPGAEEGELPADPRFEAAYDAIERGDFAAAAGAYRQVLAETPADAEARAGLAQVELMARVDGLDPAAATAAGDADPLDVDAALQAADVALVSGNADAAFTRLIETIRRTREDDRERARIRLVELFEIVGTGDPAVVRARAALASALF